MAKIWDAESGKEFRTLKGHSGSVGATTFSPDGRRVLTSWDHTVEIWDAVDWTITKEEYQPDGSWIAVLELAAGAHGDLLDRIGSLTHGTAETKQL